jgi:ribosomal protein L14
MSKKREASLGPLPQFEDREDCIQTLMERRTQEFPQGYPREVAEQICQSIEQDQAAAHREATISGPVRQEIEKIMQATIRQYEAIRQQQGGLPYTFEENQAVLQQLKCHIYGTKQAQEIQENDKEDAEKAILDES